MKYLLIFTLITIISTTDALAQAKRTRVLDFEDDVIEGMNKKPLDSLQQINDSRKNKRAYLYRKRKAFSVENLELLEDVRFVK